MRAGMRWWLAANQTAAARCRRTIVGAVIAAGVTTSPAVVAAHSLDELEERLFQSEPYFQAIDRPTPAFALQDADGRSVTLGDFQGKVVVLHFIYAGCPDFCPLHAEKLAEVQTLLNITPTRDQVVFVSITTDPTNDTPDVLADYGPLHGLDPTNWIFLTVRSGDREDSTRQLAASFGHRFDETTSGYQLHGVVTHVIDREGRWRANFHGLRFHPTNLAIYVNALANDIHQATTTRASPSGSNFSHGFED